MNAASISNPDIIENGEDSDSDTNSEGIPDYYQPIGSYNGDDNEGVDVGLPNGHHHPALAGACVEDSIEDDDDEQEDEEETRRVESELAARRAFEEDESRRNAPLPNENITRVMEAMRGVSVSGFAPDWAHEDRWLDDLHRLRHSSRSPA
ncbi:uncharacterized protein LOC141591637 [Silene latifolia]|uniref:uncharacterized protein LOC141591637 n=1 Tax=Silene latifolia TaxID=37657 RepID=UPI003D77CC0D